VDLNEPLMTTDEVAAFLKVDVVTVRRLVARGELMAYRIGGEYRFAPQELRGFLERQQVMPRGGASPGGAAAQQMVERLAQALRGAPLDTSVAPFTRRARHALQLAVDAARTGGRGYLGTEHLLQGLIRESDGLAARVLAEIGITADAVLAVVVGADDWPERAGGGGAGAELQLTEQARQVIAGAVAQAEEWEHQYVGTEHLLFALTKAEDGNIVFLLEQLGVAPDTVQGEVLETMCLGAGGMLR